MADTAPSGDSGKAPDVRRETQLTKAIQTAVNSSGLPLQFAAISTSRDAHRSKKSQWVFSVSEYPVATESEETRIDFCLESPQSDCFMVVECKRSHPSFSCWSFLKAPYTNREDDTEYFLGDTVHMGHHPKAFRVDAGYGELLGEDAVHFAFPVRHTFDPKQPEAAGQNPRDEAEKSAGQVCRAVNGLIDSFRRHPGYSPERSVSVVPVIVTTAKLFRVKADLLGADLHSGRLALDPDMLMPSPWVAWQYPVSPGLKHGYIAPRKTANPARLLRSVFLRTIFVIDATSFAEFLRRFTPDMFIGLRDNEPRPDMFNKL